MIIISNNRLLREQKITECKVPEYTIYSMYIHSALATLCVGGRIKIEMQLNYYTLSL